MADYEETKKRSNIDPKVRANILAKVYGEITRWSLPEQQTTSPDELDTETGKSKLHHDSESNAEIKQQNGGAP